MKKEFIDAIFSALIGGVLNEELRGKTLKDAPDPGPNSFSPKNVYEVTSLQEREDLLKYAEERGVPFEPNFTEMTMGTIREYPNFGWCPCNRIDATRKVGELKAEYQLHTAEDFRNHCDAYQENQWAAAKKENEINSFSDALRYSTRKAGSQVTGLIKIPGTPESLNRFEALGKCQIIWNALTDGWTPGKDEQAWYVVVNKKTSDLNATRMSCESDSGIVIFNPWPFPTEELAQKAIAIAPEQWLSAFGF